MTATITAKKAIVSRVRTTSSAPPPPGSTTRPSAMSAMTPNFHANCTPRTLRGPRRLATRAEAIIDPRHGELRELRGREQVALGLADVVAHADPGGQGRPGDGRKRILVEPEPLVGECSVRVDVGERSLHGAAALDDSHAERHRALVRHFGDRLGVVEQGDCLEWRAEQEDLAHRLYEPSKRAAPAVRVFLGVRPR